ncbi:hypothetical protein CF335_g820 [Tilletia laevis]|nr:hypothetical protein CF335_g820 [Tilletia laevis]
MRCASFRLSHHPSSLFSSSTNTSSDSTAAFVHVPAHARPSCEQQRARRVASCRRRVSLRTRVQRPDVSAGPPPYNPYHKHLQPPPPAPSDPAPSSSMMSGPGGAGRGGGGASSSMMSGPGGAAQRRSRRTAAAAAAASVPAAAMSTHYAPNPAASFQQSPPPPPPPPPPHLPHAPGPSASSSTTATTSPTSIHGGSTTTDRASLPRILEVAGVDEGKRTMILEKEIQQEIQLYSRDSVTKVQGGYGTYQGTWKPRPPILFLLTLLFLFLYPLLPLNKCSHPKNRSGRTSLGP